MDVLKVDQWRQRFIRALLPPQCLICGERGGNGLDLCGACVSTLPWLAYGCARCAIPLPEAGVCGPCQRAAPPLASARATFVYGFPIDQLVPRLKFHRDLASGHLLAELMARGWQANPAEVGVLMPIPLHRGRLRERGYDQARELARALARRIDAPVLDSHLMRARPTHAQSELDAAARKRNLRNAFVVRGTPPPHVTLIDDVMTTGTTLHAAARALTRAGVQRVDAWVCARVP